MKPSIPRVDADLLENAKFHLGATISQIDDVAARYADLFRQNVIEPFCRRHNLRFFSGHGTWWFESPNGTKFDDPDDTLLCWCRAVDLAEHRDPKIRGIMPYWAPCAREEDIPLFIQNLRGIDEILASDFMGQCFGYWVDSYDPSSSEDEEPKDAS